MWFKEKPTNIFASFNTAVDFLNSEDLETSELLKSYRDKKFTPQKVVNFACRIKLPLNDRELDILV